MWMILILSQTCIDSHLFFHLIVVSGHVISHPVHHEVLSLSLESLLIVAKLSCKQVCLLVFKLLRLLLSFFVILEAHNLIHVSTASILNLTCINEPHVVTVVSDELSLHLKYFDLSYLLQVVTHFQALDVGILVKVSLFEKFVLVKYAELFVIDVHLHSLWACGVKWCSEFNSDCVRLCVLICEDTTLNVVDQAGFFR